MELDYITHIRRTLHMYPELGFEEYKTTELIKSELDKMGIAYDSPLGTGCVAYIKGTGTSSIAFRADIDALPIQEENDVPYRSQRDGVMHACGHDGHTTMLLALIRRIKQSHDIIPLSSTVYFIFQPSEESGAGAHHLLDAYQFEIQPSYIFGLHMQPDNDEGTLLSRPGALTASATEYRFFINGTSSHVANKEQGHSTAEALTMILNQISQIQHYHLPGLKSNIIHIGKLHAGEAINTVPSNGYLEGTIRTYDMDNLAVIKQQMEHIANSAQVITSCTIEVKFAEGYPPTINNESAYAFMSEALIDSKINRIEKEEPYLFGEDFSFYGKVIPSTFAFLGCRNEDKHFVTGLHTSTFNFDESALIYGIDVLEAIFNRFEGLQ